MNWRLYLYNRLVSIAATIGIPATSVFAGGSLSGSPAVRPFLVYRLHETTPRLKDDGAPVATGQRMEVWAYDNPGSYDTIDANLKAVRDGLTGQVAQPGGVAVEWTGDGTELFDDDFKAIVRVGSYNLIGVQ